MRRSILSPEVRVEIKRRVDEAPPLTPAQRDRLAALLRPMKRNPNTRARSPKDAA